MELLSAPTRVEPRESIDRCKGRERADTSSTTSTSVGVNVRSAGGLLFAVTRESKERKMLKEWEFGGEKGRDVDWMQW